MLVKGFGMVRRWSVVFLFQMITAGCVALVLSTLPASANAKYAAMVVDGYTGKMIYGRNVDSPRYPASITKVMTLYIVFEELRAGRLKKSTRLKVSKYASGRPPSKLGLRPGETITVDTAIRALVTKSANDVATVVAENISGTQTKFAKRMTRTARAIGMTKTTFRNPHGLPDRRQKTTARDLIKLSMRIQADFPKLYSYFSVKKFTFRGRTFRNYNKLLGRFKGTTGIKTGYIRASGYNLTAVVKRGNKKVVAVVLGGKTGRSRDAQMRKLITNAFPKVVAYNGPPPTPVRLALARPAPIPGQKPARTPVSVKNTVKPHVLPVSGEADAVASSNAIVGPNTIAGQKEGILLMRIAALAPRNREMPLAEPVSRVYAVAKASPARVPNRAKAPQLRSIDYQSLASNEPALGGFATTAYAAVQNNQVISSIAALIANSAISTGARPETTPALRPAIAVAENPLGNLRLANLPADRRQDRPAKRVARLILPPSSTVDQPVAQPAANPTPALAAGSSEPARNRIPKALERQATAAATQPQAEVTPPPVVIPDGYQIQVGAYVYKQKAEERIDEVRKAARRLLANSMGIAVQAENDKGTFYRARFAGLAKRNANRTCKALKKRRIPCIVLAQ